MSHTTRPEGPTGEFVRTNSHGPHPFDVAVGRRLRMARKARSLSQGQLAESIGLSSHQQVQKYERGADLPPAGPSIIVRAQGVDS